MAMSGRSNADAAAASFLAQYTQAGQPTRTLSQEQEAVIAEALAGHDVIVDASVGSGKTTTIQELCNRLPLSTRILYLTYSKLLKLDAKERIRNRNVTVHNYHGLAWYFLKRLGVRTGVSTSIERTVAQFDRLVERGLVPTYDVIIIDEYQDVIGEYAELLLCLRSVSPQAQFIVVGDMSQKLRDNTSLDVEGFFEEITHDAVHLPMLCSFRMGQSLGESLSHAWQKQIIGVNPEQIVQTVKLDEALRIMLRTKPSDMLVLGKRGGKAAQVLNRLESIAGDVFNKNTVYSSISTDDALTRPGKEHAIFTTYDASKGLERRVLFIFDYDESYWFVRKRMPGVNPQILRNIFLVAASRGKEEIYFVEPEETTVTVVDERGEELDLVRPLGEHYSWSGFIGGVYEGSFIEAGDTQRPVYNHALNPSSMYDFVFAEHVKACYDQLECERIDDEQSETITMPFSDGLIDLSFVLGWYQEALFFESWDARRELFSVAQARGSSANDIISLCYPLLSGVTAGMEHTDEYIQSRDPKVLWHDCLVLAYAQTGLYRYISQVDVMPDEDTCRALVDRISEHLDPTMDSQGYVIGDGIIVDAHDRQMATEIIISGRVDAMEPGRRAVWELKYVTELTREHFCQLGMYLALSGVEQGYLFNTRTGEIWSVRVPHPGTYLDVSIRCATKGWYVSFQGRTQYMAPEALRTSRVGLHDTSTNRMVQEMVAARREREKKMEKKER